MTKNRYEDSPYKIVDGIIARASVLKKNIITLKVMFVLYFQRMTLLIRLLLKT